MYIVEHICSARTRNLRNPRIALRKIGIRTLARNPGIAQPIQLLRTRDVAQTYDHWNIFLFFFFFIFFFIDQKGSSIAQ